MYIHIIWPGGAAAPAPPRLFSSHGANLDEKLAKRH